MDNKFLKKVSDYAEKYHMLSEGDVVAAGISGGADSVCLLFVLLELQRKISFSLMAVHVNHRIRQEAAQDAAYTAALCRRLGVPFYLVERDVETLAKEQGISTEEAGRQVRYEAFWQILRQQAPEAVQGGRAKIAVAHNSNDRAETMLFHLFRGTGLTGLCSIRPVRGEVIRPLLIAERSEIETFLAEKGVSYCIDRTNAEDTYTRNKIRHHILPYAEKEIVSGAVSHMGNTAELLLETEDFVRQSAETAYKQCVVKKQHSLHKVLQMDIAQMQKCHPLICREVILLTLGELMPLRKDIGLVHVQDIGALLERAGNREIMLPYDIRVRREYEQLIFEQRSDEGAKEEERGNGREYVIFPNPVCEIEISGLGTLEFSTFFCEKSPNIPQNQYTKWFDYDKIEKSLKVRHRQTGDYLTINEALSRKSLQDYMVNEKIPGQLRDEMWLLADGEHILWVIGYRISQKYKVTENTKRILQVQLRGGHEHGRTC